MRYREILESVLDDARETLTTRVLDMLTPLAANGVEYVTIKQLLDKLKTMPTGLLIDREFIMDVLSPDKFPIIKSIEGDKVYLTHRIGADRLITQDQKGKEEENIKKTAQKKAMDDIKGK